ncbi:MAG: hypothetical protein OEW00_07710 [candidate division Zixibacteria bacterium]|nr:hypothetical protein [candidate division Zixibacteria bacterium]
MRLFGKRLFWCLTAATVFGAALLSYVRYGDACRLTTVTVNARPMEDWSRHYGLKAGMSLLAQPLEELADSLLTVQHIYRVDLSYSWPDRVNIQTNKFVPAAFLLDKPSGQLYGLDGQARLIDLGQDALEWERPVFTSVCAGKMFRCPEDARVKVVLEQLQRLQENDRDLYRLVDEIDFGNSSFLKVSLAGLPYRLNIRAGCLLDDLDRFVEFVTRFEPDLSGVTLLDLRFDDMVIAKGDKD